MIIVERVHVETVLLELTLTYMLSSTKMVCLNRTLH